MFSTKALKRQIAEQQQTIAQLTAKLTTIDRAMARIEFSPEGVVTDANDSFLTVMGYQRAEIVGQHHRMFCEPEWTSSRDYAEHWARLARGEFVTGRFKRRNKQGRTVWIEAMYGPVLGPQGRVEAVVKYALDVTRDAEAALRAQGLVDAVDRSNAVIEFEPDGTIITANANFLNTVGYALNEIAGRHHRMFCEAEYASGPEYASFWRRLAHGEFMSGQFHRVGKGGRSIWLEATYNPVTDASGKVIRVVKFAADISERVQRVQREVENAHGSLDISRQAADHARESARVIENASAKMQAISSSAEAAAETISDLGEQSSQITSIVQTIREIADQTNLLALNAAIEAARAGEQGRGFAVVADEVRKLAERTSNATTDISSKINVVQEGTRSAIARMQDTRERAGESVQLAGEASRAMLSVREQTERVVEVVEGFAAALQSK
ncbi:MAG: methyl-accepting chemotaxis protein [Rhodocyclaceae bacterium]